MFAIPDHPWVDAGEGAAVRIAMTVAAPGAMPGRLFTVVDEKKSDQGGDGRVVGLSGEIGRIFGSLRVGADVAGAHSLRANEGLAHMGIKLHGMGFIVTPNEAQHLGLSSVSGLQYHIRPFINGRDLAQSSRGSMVIDLYGLDDADVRHRFPAVYQHLLDNVKPERDQNNRETYKKNWWIHGEPRKDMRPALKALPRYIGTTRTAKHRLFQFIDSSVLAESKIVVVALMDGSDLSVLSSKVHEIFARTAGGWLGFGNDPTYNHSDCFNPFPFPEVTDAQKASLRLLGEELDAHRKAQQAAHPKLTLTAMYNVLEKLRVGDRIEGKDKKTYDQGLIGILRGIHDRIDAEVAAAYGWPLELSDDDILHRLVALNRERAAEEARGLVRWLRPEYQNPTGQTLVQAVQIEADLELTSTTARIHWPSTIQQQIAVVYTTLEQLGKASPAEVARCFGRVRSSSVEPLLEGLSFIGKVQRLPDGRFLAS